MKQLGGAPHARCNSSRPRRAAQTTPIPATVIVGRALDEHHAVCGRIVARESLPRRDDSSLTSQTAMSSGASTATADGGSTRKSSGDRARDLDDG